MPTVRTGPLTGLIAQVVLLATLAATVRLSAAAWLAGVGFGVVTCVLLGVALDRSAAAGLGPANRVTLARAVLVGGVAALTVQTLHHAVPLRVLVGLVVLALVLDGVDGQVARRTGSVTALGARFDMEVDAFLLLVLSIYVTWPHGPWTLAIGLMRYAFVAAMGPLPWMRRTLPPRFWRKVVAAAQGVALVVATAHVLPPLASAVGLVGALLLLVESFGRDVWWLWRHRVVVPETVRPQTARPATVQPATAEPAPVQPATAQPTTAQPATAEPEPALASGRHRAMVSHVA